MPLVQSIGIFTKKIVKILNFIFYRLNGKSNNYLNSISILKVESLNVFRISWRT